MKLKKEYFEIRLPKFPYYIELSHSRRAKFKLNRRGEKTLTNPRTAGTPRFWKINGQSIYSGMHFRKRSFIVKKMKEFIQPHISNLPVLGKFPISVRLIIRDVPGKWDLDNRGWIWIKCFQDCLVAQKKITDDAVGFINDTGRLTFIPVKNPENRLMTFVIKSPNII